ncbi:MAG: adenylate/guanylate cyclase domain-containing protein [Candidatus Binatia bacterium]
MSRWWARRRLRTRIFLPFSMLIVAILLATMWVIGFTVSGWVENSVKRQFAVTGNVFRGLMAGRAERLLGETSLLAGDFGLKRALATYDPDTLTSVALNHRERIGVDLLLITDEQGRLLAGSGARAEVGRSLAGQAPLAQVLESGLPAEAITEIDGGLVQVVAVPVLGPDPIGYLLTGEAIDDNTARQLETTTNTAVSFVTASRIFATSWPAGARDASVPLRSQTLQSELARAAGSGTGEGPTFVLNREGARLLSIFLPIEAALTEPLYVLVQDSYNRALGPLAALPTWVSIIGIAALIGALLVGGLIAGGIAAPVQILVAAMRRVLTGDFGQRLRVGREDEIGFLASSFNEMVAGLAEREHIKETFGRFVSRDVAAAVLSGLPLKGERREVTILFQDVRGFTTVAERTEPTELVRLVNQLFTVMVAAVEAEGGIIRQFTGDGVMALFGAPVLHEDDPARAARAAVDMMQRLPALNRQLASDGLPEIRIGIGIHTGIVIAGQMGPDQRSEYSVVGDAPNLASRIEGLTKEMQTQILVSAVTAGRLGPEFDLGRRAVLAVKGKEQPVEVVELLGYRAVV